VVTAADVTLYAEWDVDASNDEMVGSMGGQSFGAIADRETDMDQARWRAIATGRTGQVLTALSQAASKRLEDSTLQTVRAQLGDLSRMSKVLSQMAGIKAPVAEGEVQSDTSGYGYFYKFATVWTKTECWLSSTLCYHHFHSYTERLLPSWIDSSELCVRQYDERANTLHTSCGENSVEQVEDVVFDALTPSKHCRFAKHWRVGSSDAARWSYACNNY